MTALAAIAALLGFAIGATTPEPMPHAHAAVVAGAQKARASAAPRAVASATPRAWAPATAREPASPAPAASPSAGSPAPADAIASLARQVDELAKESQALGARLGDLAKDQRDLAPTVAALVEAERARTEREQAAEQESATAEQDRVEREQALQDELARIERDLQNHGAAIETAWQQLQLQHNDLVALFNLVAAAERNLGVGMAPPAPMPQQPFAPPVMPRR